MAKNNNRNYVRALMLLSARRANILPVTSHCNMRCLFCSNRQNPPGVEVYTTGHRKLVEIEEALEFMDGDRPVVIGESVTRVSEGEPFTHPRIRDILQLVRSRLPRAPIQITTNGSLLDESLVDFLASLGKVSLYLSLNSANPRVRAEIMGDGRSGLAINNVRLLRRAGLEFHGSIVALLHLFGPGDVVETACYLEREGARTIRIFIPAYTRFAPPGRQLPAGLDRQIRDLVYNLRQRITVPVTCEPPCLDNLNPEVAGVIPGSPAERAGLRAGDLITGVSGYRPYSRVAAFRRLRQSSRPEVTWKRNGQEFTGQLAKEEGEAPGVVMEYDLGPEWEGVEEAARRHRANRVLVVTSRLAAGVVKLGLRLFMPHLEWRVVVCPSRFFGGTIAAAGLLTVEDMIAAIRAFKRENPAWQPDLLLLPPLAFDHAGRDLTGRHFYEAGEKTALPVELI